MNVLYDRISIQQQREMADAVKHAMAMICAKHFSLFFSNWDDEDHHHHHEAMNAILTFQCHQKGEPDKEKSKQQK